MNGFLKTLFLTGTVSAMLFTFTLNDYADASNRGKGQMLRDGSAIGSQSQYQGKGQRGDCLQTGTCPNGGIGGYGDGTRPRPQDGTGFGARR